MYMILYAIMHSLESQWSVNVNAPLCISKKTGIAFLPLVVSFSAQADLVSQELIRQHERENALRQSLQPRDASQAPPHPTPREARFPMNETPCVILRDVRLTGASNDRFQWLLSTLNELDGPVRGRCLGSHGLRLIVSHMQNALVDRGFVTSRVLAEPQELSKGDLVLTLIPGRIHSIRFTGNSSPQATSWNALPARPGDLLNLRDIEQALENFKRLPTVDADIQITPSEAADARPGDSDVVIAWKQTLPFRLSLSLDDSGSKSTGRYQGSLSLSHDGMLALNDLFYVSINHDLDGKSRRTRATEGYAFHFEVPFGYWRLGLDSSRYEYRQAVSGAYQTYLYRGKSDRQEIRLSRGLYRDAVRMFGGHLQGWVRSSSNYIDDAEILVQRRRMSGWEFGVTHREFIVAATLEASLAYRRGTGALAALPASEENFGSGTSRPQLSTADVQLTLPFHMGRFRWRYNGRWRAQWNHTPLIPQDRFSIGGRHSVRGFDGESTLLAERGWWLRNDLAVGLGRSGQTLYVGLDHGEVSGPSTEYLVGRRLTGGVVGLRGSFKNLSYDVFLGQTLNKPEYFRTSDTTAGGSIHLTW